MSRSDSDTSLRNPSYHHRIRRNQMIWGNVIAIGALHVGALLAPFFFSWSAVGVGILLWWISGGLGICLGYHRLLTHRSFETSKIVEYALTVFGNLTWQGSPIRWVGTHRMHHRDSDTETDPHSPQHGFSWAHSLWCLMEDPLGRNPCDLAKDMQRDRGHVLLDRFFWLPQIVLAVVLYALGGWPWVIWGVCVRTVFTYHATWFVNSAAHTWGYRNFDTRENSHNTWWVALVSFGEGWHNNHHAFARSARHGLRWWEIDLTYVTIRVMEMLGLARNVHAVKWRNIEGERA